jgi:hypothetical protein
MAATNFATPVNNATTTIASSYTSGSGTMTVANGAVFPNPSAPAFLRVTVIQAGVAYSPLATSSNYTIYKVTGVSGNVLTIGSTLEGTTDRNYSAGDVVQSRATAGSATDIQTAVNTLENTYPDQGLTYGNAVLPSGSSPYVLAGSSGVFTTINGAGFSITLPAVATYLILLTVRVYLQIPASSSLAIAVQLFNNTLGSAVTNSANLVFFNTNQSATANAIFQLETTFSILVTTGTINNVIQMQAEQIITGSGSANNQIISDGAGFTTMTYLRLV